MPKKPDPKPLRRVPTVLGADRYAQYVMADVHAIKALAAGTANEDQQDRAYRWILSDACQVRNVSYVRGDSHETAFNEGRRFVGLEIIKMTAASLDELRRGDGHNEGSQEQ